MATSSQDGSAKLWDIDSGRCLFSFTGHRHAVRGIAFSPDDRKIATGSFDCTAKLWDIETGKCIQTFSGGHTHWIRSVCFMNDGKILITGSRDQTACFWDSESGNLLVKLYNLNDGFLWTAPPDNNAKHGWIWTNRENFIHVVEIDSHSGMASLLPMDDQRCKEYLAVYNNREQVMSRIRMNGSDKSELFANLEQVYKNIHHNKSLPKQLNEPRLYQGSFN